MSFGGVVCCSREARMNPLDAKSEEFQSVSGAMSSKFRDLVYSMLSAPRSKLASQCVM
jgi:hypothetical protein